jgi:hypothetical protein
MGGVLRVLQSEVTASASRIRHLRLR